MEDSISAMERVLQESGKEPKQDQKKVYYMAIYQLLNEEGFSNNVQEYMNKGFKFVKMRPFKAYFTRKEESEKEDLLNQLFKSDFLRKDKSRAFTALINLLALFISGKIDHKYCRSVVNEIPNYCYNKEGNTLGNANGVMLNSFYSELTVVPNTFNYEKLFDSEEIRTQFEKLLVNSIEYAYSIRKLTAKQKEAVEMVKKWIPNAEILIKQDNSEKQIMATSNGPQDDISQQYEIGNESLSETKTDSKSLEQKDGLMNNASALNSVALENKEQPKTDSKEQASNDSTYDVRIFPAILEQLLNRIDRLNSTIDKSNGNTEVLLRTQQAYIDNLNSSIEMEKINNGHIRDRNIELTEEVQSLQKTVDNLRRQLAEKEEENRSLKAMLEVSSKEGDRKFNEQILKLTDRLSFEYQDYISVKNIAMSIDLGENMRGQLGDVFDVLKKAGLDIDSK